MHILIVEPGYADSVWCKALVQGLKGELKKRREDFCIHSQVPSLTSDDRVFVIGSAFGWLDQTVRKCNGADTVPVLLCSSLQPISGGRYHQVYSDIDGSMRQLTAALQRAHGRRIALYGINPDSAGDRIRAQAFLSENPDRNAIFENSVSLDQCYRRFSPRAEEFDAVICANGFAAVSLVKRLQSDRPQVLAGLTVISCAQSLLARYCGERITSVDMHFEQFGKTALGIADIARKQPHIAGITAAVKWSVKGLSLGNVPPAPAAVPAESGAFYSDDELQQMLRLENLLNSCDDIDLQLLTMLLQDKSYAHMADVCFLTEGAVKYRIRNIRDLCGADGKETLTSLLREYLLWE